MLSLFESKSLNLEKKSYENSTGQKIALSQLLLKEHYFLKNEIARDLLKTKLKIIGKIDSKYYLIKKLGEGSYSKVYLGVSIEQLENKNIKDEIKYYSIKVINPLKSNISMFKNEVQFLENIDHDNILKIYAYGVGVKSKIKDEIIKEKNIFYIVMEYLKHGDLSNYITKISPLEQKGFGEELGKLIFSQLLDRLEELHSKNIFHRDIKLENIMLGNDYKFQFIDFGFSTDEIGILRTYLGTPLYTAPELHLQRGYFAKSEDIFSLGVALFIIVTGALPFKLAAPNDAFYQFIIKNDYVGFWQKRMINVSPSFMELFDNMVAFDYSQRPSISEIRQSTWMKDINYGLLPLLKKELNFREQLIEKMKNDDIINEIKLNENSKKLSLLEVKPIRNNSDINEIQKRCINNNINLNVGKKNNSKKIKKIKGNKNINNSHKGFIRVKFESKNLNIALNRLKKYFKHKGFNRITINENPFILRIIKSKIDIILNLEKNNNIYIKINYYKIKGTKAQFDNFKKIIYQLKDKNL